MAERVEDMPSLEEMGVSLLGRGKVRVRIGSWYAPNKRMLVLQEFNSMDEAVRGMAHARESEEKSVEEVNELVNKILGIHREIEGLGRGSTLKKRMPYLKELKKHLGTLERKRKELKVRAKGLLAGHEGKEAGEFKLGAVDLLKPGNWPAAQACLAVIPLHLGKEVSVVENTVIPRLRQREAALRIHAALDHLRAAHSELSKERPSAESARKSIESTLEHISIVLDPARHDRIFIPLKNSLKKLSESNPEDARNAVLAAGKRLKALAPKKRR
ncbi:hypothetical protein COX85_03750 [Candidatus Micrarchaeota archaeon CG_4_10_14_0_2_um_filter_55_9]|nr:MAG: hypothetical protein AUJ15_00945 [Candidatus Micrarchaeota archaeon CG1_02_55_41]PIO02500.1 MAG: hypothetical protein COT57_03705 [Candidatus Micrarchaeota archaeon CG09_land_8_20_14_0_10_55_25]PIZ91498.1 MAG: hypothetical protein COX85_03750 [Candidatus Micrarchaeota archaeon CG_4_10_14_0_2_um_filter_55_9]